MLKKYKEFSLINSEIYLDKNYEYKVSNFGLVNGA